MASPQGFSVTIPVELEHAIVDALRSDVRALASCSKVCKSWRLRAHHHTFRTVVLAWASVTFFDELTNDEFSAPAIISSVKAIHIRGPPISFKAWDLQRLAALSAVLSRLAPSGNIGRLALQNLTWATLPSDIPPFIFQSDFSSIVTLELLETHFSSREDLIGFLEKFHGLRHLVLQDVDARITPKTTPCWIPAGGYGLALRCPRDFTLRNRLQWDRKPTGEIVPATQLADLAILMSASKEHVSDILPILGRSLYYLQLSSETIHTYPDACLNQLDLSRTTALKQLSLGSSRRVLSLLPWVPYILSQIPMVERPTLSFIRIAFASSRQFHLDRPSLLYIAEVLSRPQFQRLKIIQFVVFNSTVDDELQQIVKQTICEALGSWYSKGVLVFTFSKS